MLSRPHRITSGSDYRIVVRRGRRCGGARLVTSVLSTGEDRPARFGFIVSKQVGSAVVRNTVRRRLKALCAREFLVLPAGTDVVFRALPASATASFDELAADVRRCLKPRTAS